MTRAVRASTAALGQQPIGRRGFGQPLDLPVHHRTQLNADPGHEGIRNLEVSFTCQDSSPESWGAKPRFTRARLCYPSERWITLLRARGGSRDYYRRFNPSLTLFVR